MKQILLFTLMSLTCFIAEAQTANLSWAKQYGGPDEQLAYDLTKDPFGNIISTGYFKGFADFNPGAASNVLTSAGGKDCYLGKLNADGSYAWSYKFGGTGDDIGYKVATDNLGNIILCGQFTESMDVDPGTNVVTLTGAAGSMSGFVLKLDPNGNYLWSITFSSPSGGSVIQPSAIDMDDNGNMVVAGGLNISGSGDVDFNPGAASNSLTGAYRYFMVKITSGGAFVWLKGLEGYAGYDATISDIILDGSSNIYLAGTYTSIIDFDPGAGNYSINGNGPSDAFVAKYTNTGDFVWLQYWYDPGYAITCNALDIDNDGNLYIAGKFNYNADLNPDLIGTAVFTASSYQGFLVKLDGDGVFIYAKATSEGSTFSICQDVTHDDNNNVYYVGYFTGNADLDPNAGQVSATNTGGYNDFYVTKLDADGGFIYANHFGANYEETCRAIIYDGQSSSYSITGDFATTFDTDPDALDVSNLTTGGLSDSYIIRYSEITCAAVVAEETFTSCGNYDWNGQIYTDSGTYTQVLTTFEGCDSTVTLHLTIASGSTSNMSMTACVQYAFDGQELTESGNYIGTFVNSSGCDSLVYLNLTIVAYPTLELSISGNSILCTSNADVFQWFDCSNNQPIDGATSSSFSPTQSGSYGVNVDSGVCIESDCIDFTYIGIIEKEEHQVSIYPNPARDRITISSLGTHPIRQIEIVSSEGRLFSSENVNGDFLQTDVSELTPGIYFIKAISADGRASYQKLIIE